jgi:hypothetical protein
VVSVHTADKHHRFFRSVLAFDDLQFLPSHCLRKECLMDGGPIGRRPRLFKQDQFTCLDEISSSEAV